jgi:hypothetical protein
MNVPNSPSTPPLIPPAGPPAYALPYGETPLGSNSIELTPIVGVIGTVDAMLRQPRRLMYQLKQPNAGSLISSLLLIAVVCSLVYGIVVGTFSLGDQLWAAPVKIVAGLFISALLCLPSLYIFSCLGGSQAKLTEVFGLVASLLALMTVLMFGFAPVAWVFSASTKSLAIMGGLHLVFWFVATLFGLRFLNAAFRHFNARSDAGLKVWTVIFLLVALQMSTALRPIIGQSDRFLPRADDKMFFVSHWFDSIDKENSWKEQPPVNQLPGQAR